MVETKRFNKRLVRPDIVWEPFVIIIVAVGAGLSHHSELDEAIYKEADVYVDHMDSAKTELAGLEKIGVKFAGEIGEVIAGTLKPVPSKKITVFQSLGKLEKT